MIQNKIIRLLEVLGLTLLVFVVLMILLNFGFFWQNFLYYTGANVAIPPKNFQTVVQPNHLTISSLGISAPVIYASQPNEKSFQAALLNGAAHYPGTANPGELGNDYIFGHSSDYIWSNGHYKNVFALLPKIKLGAEIDLSGPDGKRFVYIVTDSRKVATNDLSVLSQQDYKQKLLTLQTSYPVGTALARWVVVGEEKP